MRITSRARRYASWVLAEAVKAGKVEKPDRCEECGEWLPKWRLHAHHPDPNNALDVIWLCGTCHPVYERMERLLEEYPIDFGSSEDESPL